MREQSLDISLDKNEKSSDARQERASSLRDLILCVLVLLVIPPANFNTKVCFIAVILYSGTGTHQNLSNKDGNLLI